MAGGELAGTVTFLLTDIVGSTQLWEHDSAAMAAAMVVHDGVIEGVVARCGGTVVRPRGEGDSRFAVFGRASDAASAAVAVVAGLSTASWVTAEPVQVRVGLHTGEVEARDGDYYGTAVNLCARLRGLAYPSQVLMSETTARLVGATPPAGVSVRDVGRHRLKGLRTPELVFQLCHTDLPDDFPALVSEGLQGLPAFRPPAKRTLIGRGEVVDTVVAALDEARLVCLVGPGGVGKTSIAEQVVARQVDSQHEGVSVVDLALIRDRALVTTVVGTALGMRSSESGIALADIIDVLSGRELLLYIDNCEHLIDDAANLVDAVLRACPGVKVLATSREPLDIVDEVVFIVDSLGDEAAVELFILRARAADPSFNPSPADREAVAQICRAVDGLPLGIELVSARVRALTPAEILDQLNVLRVERRGATARHHTLDAAIGWSYELLTSSRQAVLRRMSVFQGGTDTTAAVRVCAATTAEARSVGDDLHALVSRSLVVADRTPEGVRYRLLETVRAYASGQLDLAAEAETARARLVAWALDWAQSTRKQLEGPDPAPAFAALAREEANIRAAYATCRDSGDDRSLVRLVGAFGPFGLGSSGVVGEVDEWIDRALAVEQAPPSDRLQVLLLAIWRLDLAREDMVALVEEALHLAIVAGDVAAQMFALGRLGERFMEDERGIPLLKQAIALAAQADNPLYLASALSPMANVLLRRRAVEDARRLLEDAFTDGTTQFGLLEPTVIYHAGRAALIAADLDHAGTAFAAAEDAAQRTASPIGLSYALFGKGSLAFARGDLVEARRWYEEAMAISMLAKRDEVSLEHYTLAKVCATQGDIEALTAHTTALEATAGFGPIHRGLADVAVGMLAIARGRAADAEPLFRAAIETLAAIPTVEPVADAIDGLAACAAARGDPARASLLTDLAAGLRDGSRPVESVAEAVRQL